MADSVEPADRGVGPRRAEARREDPRRQPLRAHRADDEAAAGNSGHLVKHLCHVVKAARHEGDLRDVAAPAELLQRLRQVLHRTVELVERPHHLRAGGVGKFQELLATEPLLEVHIVKNTLCVLLDHRSLGEGGCGEDLLEELRPLALGALVRSAVADAAESQHGRNLPRGLLRQHLRELRGLRALFFPEQVDAQLHHVGEVALGPELPDVLFQSLAGERQADARTRRLVGEDRVHHRERRRRLHHRHRSEHNARVVPPLHLEPHLLHRPEVHRVLPHEHGRGWTHRHREHHRHPVGAPAEDSALAQRGGDDPPVLDAELVVVPRSRRGADRPVAGLLAEYDALHAGNAEHRRGNASLESLEERTAEPRRQPLDRAADDPADGIAALARLQDRLLVVLLRAAGDVADRRDMRVDGDAAPRQPLQRERAGGAERRGEAARVLAAAGRNTPRLDPLAEVGVAGTRHRALRAVVAGPRVAVRDFAADGPAAGHAVRPDSRNPLHLVRLAPRGGERVAPGRAARHERGERGAVHREPGRKSVERKRHLPGVRSAADVEAEKTTEAHLRPFFEKILCIIPYFPPRRR